MTVEIQSFRKYEKNTLKGFLSVRLTGVSLEIRDICLHEKNGSRWLALPAKQYEKDGETSWMPIIRFYDKDVWEKFQSTVLQSLAKYQQVKEPDQSEIPF